MRRAGGRDWTAIPVHPLLAAAYPVIFLFAVNQAEQVTLDPLWSHLALAIGGALAVMALLVALLRDVQRAALLTTVLVIGFFGYGHAWNLASSYLDTQWPVIVAWLVLIVIGLAAAWRAGRHAPLVSRGLNSVAAIAVLISGSSVAGTFVVLGTVDPPPPADLGTVHLDPEGEPPDVYYVVLDRYAGSTALRETYDFDNEPFLTELERRGFSVARSAHANYIKTPLSLASTLNMEFLDGQALREAASAGDDRGPIHRALQEPLVVPRALKELGYRYIQVANWWTPTQSNVDADRVFRYEGQDGFSSALSQTTLLRAITDPDSAPDDPWDWRVMRENNLYALDRLDEIPALPGPKYVFAHLVTTHPPYVHDTDGSYTGRQVVSERGDEESYRRQLAYANARMLAFVDRVLAESEDAVIVLAGDEGPFPARYRADTWAFDWRDATDAELEEKFGTIVAVRAPGADLETAGFHDEITLVNVFRVLFNARFGTDLDLLPDRVWAHENLANFYDFFEITDHLDR